MSSFQDEWSTVVVSQPFRLLVFLTLLLPFTVNASGHKANPAGQSLATMPLTFEENEGQFSREISYVGRSQFYSVGVERNGLRFVMPGTRASSEVDVRFAGSHGGSPAALSGAAYRTNYFLGSDRTQWRQGIPNFTRVGLREIYPGIDAEFYEKNGQLEHDFVVAPGKDSARIQLDLESARQATLTSNGEVVLPSKTGELRFRKPAAYQFDDAGNCLAVPVAYVLKGHRLHFRLGAYDKGRTLVIDPVIVFATYFSGAQGSTASQLTADAAGTHLYITGSTPSVLSSFPSATLINKNGLGDPVSPATDVYVAGLTTSALGSTVDWIAFLGGSGSSTSTSIAYSAANSGTIYVGGSTAASNFSGTASGTFPQGTGSVSGFVTSLNVTQTSTPAIQVVSTFVTTVAPSSSTTDASVVSGLAADGVGNVYVSGYGQGGELAVTKQLALTGIGDQPTTHNAFVAELNSSLALQLATYVQSETAGDYKATGIQVDGSGNIYVSGMTSDTFPMAQASNPANGFSNSTDYSGCAVKTTPSTNIFLAQIEPPGVSGNASANSILGFTIFGCGTDGSDTANGLALSGDGSSAYLVGDSSSTDLATHIFYTSYSSTASTTAPMLPGELTTHAGAGKYGYALKVPSTGVPSGFTYVGNTSGDTTFYAAAVDNTENLLQVAGTTKIPRSDMTGATSATGLPSGQDRSNAQPVSTPRGLLYTLDNNLANAKSISYFGAAVTQSAALSVQSNNAGDAFVLVDDHVPASITNAATPASFTSAAAIQPTPGTTTGAADFSYVAVVQGTEVSVTPASGLTFALDSTSPQISANGTLESCGASPLPACVIGYSNTAGDLNDISAITYTWDLSLVSAANNPVLNFPAQPFLGAYAVTANQAGTAIAVTCKNALNSNGTTCTLPSPLPASGSNPYTIALTANAAAGDANLSGQTFSLDGNVADAQGDYQDVPQPTVTVQKPVSITLDLSQTPVTGSQINASSDNSGTNGTSVTYTAVITNTSGNDSPSTTLKMTLPSSAMFKVTSVTATANGNALTAASGCDLTAGTGCLQPVLVQANNKTLVYVVTGVYLGPGFGGTTAALPAQTITAVAAALPFTNKNAPITKTLSTSINGYANMTVSVTAPTYPGPVANYTNDTTAFNLGAGPLTYKITVTNNGPNAVSTSDSSSNKLAFTNTLPAGFVVNQALTTTALANGATATCPVAGTGCSITALPSTGTITYSITGSFPDNGTSPDAVPQNMQNASVTDTATFATLPAGTYVPNVPANTPPSSAQSVTVQRLVHLKLTVAVTSTPTASGVSYTPAGFNLNSALNPTPVTYTYTLENDGPNIAVGVQLASVDAPEAALAYTAPSGSFVVTPPATTSAGSAVSCPGTTNTYASCTVASVAPGTAPTIAFNVSYPDLTPAPGVFSGRAVSAVPGDAPSAPWSYSISTPWSPVPLSGQPFPGYPNAVDNKVSASDDFKNSTSATIYRTTHLKLTLGTSTATATGASYPLQPGYNLSNNPVNYTYTLQNDGPDAAIYIPLNNTFAYSGQPPTLYVLGTGVNVAETNTNDLSCTTPPTTGLYASSCTVRRVLPTTPGTPTPTGTFVFPVTFPDTPLPLATSMAGESLSAVPTDQPFATYNYTATAPLVSTLAHPTTAYTNSIDGNPGATTLGSNTSTVPATIYRTVHLKVVLGTGASSFNLQDTVPYTYKLTNDGPNVALNVAFTGTLAAVNPPADFVVQSGYFTVPPASSGNFTCIFGAGNISSTCTAGAVPVSGTSPTVAIVSTENLPTTYSLTQPNFSAIPSGQPSLGYQYTATAVNPYAHAIDAAPAPADNSSVTNITLNRTSAITASPTVSGLATAPPCLQAGSSSPCFYMVNPNHTDDTGTYTVNIANAGPNAATNATLTFALPTNFAVPDANNPAPASTFNYTFSGSNGNLLQCTFQSATVPATATCTGLVPKGTLQAVVTSQFNGSTVPLTSSATTTGNLPGTQNSVSTNAAALKAVVTQQPLPSVTIYRAAHLITVKSVTPAPGNQSPNGFSLPVSTRGPSVAAVNLDEKVPGDAPGKNDLVQVTVQVGNGGLNDAVNVMVTDTLPAYFILTKMPDPSVANNCGLTGATTMDAAGNPMTGSSPVVLQCTFINPVRHGTGTAGTGGAHGTVTANAPQLIYYGKFQDNGRNADIIPLTQNLILAQTSTASAKSNDIQDLDAQLMATMVDLASPTPAPIPVQRAAHLRVTTTQFAQLNDAVLNPVGGVSGPGIAEAQLGANGGEAINSLRYKVTIVNDGPNTATDPILQTTLPLNAGSGSTKFVNLAQSIQPSQTAGFPVIPANCSAGQACQDAGILATGSSVTYNVDGNFDVNTLVEGNSAQRAFASSISDPAVVDSNPVATTKGDQQTSLPITVVNTPAGSNFTLAPFAANLAQPLNLTLATVQIAGITVLGTTPQASAQAMAAAVTGGAPPLPSGPSPNPSDNGATVPLYRYGQNGVYYVLGTSAEVPSGNSDPVAICLTSIPDVFQKPERVLLWALTNAPPGTAFGSVPHFANAGAGDITSQVLPQGGGSYTQPTPNTSYPPAGAQPQPAEVCGVINGLANATAPTTLAILEPVNFAPYVRSTVTAANSSNSQPGKGVTASAAQVDLTIGTQNNYDYNDQDPCYTGSDGKQRSTCNDNLQMTTFLFGGGNLIGDAQQVHTYFYGDLTANPKPQFNLPAGQPQVYVALADQLGAQGYKDVTSGGSTQVCDPGTPSASYTPTTPTCPLPTPLPTGVAVPPAQTILPLQNDTSVKVALITGNVGFGGSSGLISLPQASTPEAVAHVTAGQTAGFVWNWLTEQPQVQASSNGQTPALTLACISADGSNPASAGVQCNVPATYTYSTGSGNAQVITAPPAIYVVTNSNAAVGALKKTPLSRTAQVVAAMAFPISAIPLILSFRRRKALKLSGWLAVVFFASLVGLSVGCGSSNFKSMGGTTTTATPAGTYQFVVTATGTDSSGNPINIKTYPFAVTVTAVQ